MVFKRSVPRRKYRQYQSYRRLLRADFQNRCAYCLRHEYHVGGEGHCCIDHYRPRRGPFARPDLEAEYTNLYWACQECNSIKGDTWPDEEEWEQGFRWIDPCQPEGDHDLHWLVNPDGTLQPRTPAGEYTIENLMLWRPILQDWRAEMYQNQQEAREIERNLLLRLPSRERKFLERRLKQIMRWIEPPVFDRPHRAG
jgi:hypothetical protein